MLRYFSTAVFALLALCFLAGLAFSAPLVKASVGVNGVWLDGPQASWPNDIEAGATASASFSPHLSLTAGAFHGFENRYNRFELGPRATVTDVDNKDFNAFLGIKYRGGSKDAVNPNEWAPDAGFGWKPFPGLPRFVVGADAGYGLKSQRVLATLALRYVIPIR